MTLCSLGTGTWRWLWGGSGSAVRAPEQGHGRGLGGAGGTGQARAGWLAVLARPLSCSQSSTVNSLRGAGWCPGAWRGVARWSCWWRRGSLLSDVSSIPTHKHGGLSPPLSRFKVARTTHPRRGSLATPCVLCATLRHVCQRATLFAGLTAQTNIPS